MLLITMLANFENFLRSLCYIINSFFYNLDHFISWFYSSYPYTVQFIGISFAIIVVTFPIVVAIIDTLQNK